MTIAGVRASLRHTRGSRVLQVTTLVLAMYAAWIGTYVGTGHDVRDFIGIDAKLLANGNLGQAFNHPGEPQIHPSGYKPRAGGYDGQFVYYIALQPCCAQSYLDEPSYRYSRILLPMVARAVAVGSREAIPYALVLVNWLAVGLGTFALAKWLRRRGASPWFGLLYALFPGVFMAVQRDLTEPLAYGLAALGVLLFDTGGRWRLAAAGLAFGFAGLARQTTIVFPIVLALWSAFGGDDAGASPPQGRRVRQTLGFLALSLGPYLAYSAFLLAWLGSLSEAGDISPVPFLGLVHPPWRLSRQGIDGVFVIVPALVALIALLPREPLRSPSWRPWFLLAANVLLAVVFYGRLYEASYTTEGRVATGIVLSALLCLPYVGGLSARRRGWLVAAAALALAPLPLVALHGFVSIRA